MRILSLSTDKELCGIATYNAQLREAVICSGHEYDVFPIDTETYLTRAKAELLSHFEPFIERCRAYDAIVLQHEYGIYNAGYGIKESLRVFSSLLSRVAALRKPVLVIFHSDPPAVVGGSTGRLLQKLSSARRSWRRIVRVITRSRHIHVLVHGAEARRRFIDRGLPARRVMHILHPFPRPAPNSGWKPKDAQRSDIVLTIFGFLAPYKGYETALRALSMLPVNYRLVIAGGPHPRAVDDHTLDSILEILGVGRFGPDALRSGAKRTGLPAGQPSQPTLPNRIGSARRVTVTGWLDTEQVRDVLEETDIVLAPYTEDAPAGSGAASWGLSAGRPVIATRTRPFLEMNRAARCMRLVTQKAPFELAREILSVASDHDGQEQMVAAARDLACKHDWNSAAAYVLSLLDTKA